MSSRITMPGSGDREHEHTCFADNTPAVTVYGARLEETMKQEGWLQRAELVVVVAAVIVIALAHAISVISGS
jgi:hypothetical protein